MNEAPWHSQKSHMLPSTLLSSIARFILTVFSCCSINGSLRSNKFLAYSAWRTVTNPAKNFLHHTSVSSNNNRPESVVFGRFEKANTWHGIQSRTKNKEGRVMIHHLKELTDSNPSPGITLRHSRK
jgi:hypothetical protein